MGQLPTTLVQSYMWMSKYKNVMGSPHFSINYEHKRESKYIWKTSFLFCFLVIVYSVKLSINKLLSKVLWTKSYDMSI